MIKKKILIPIMSIMLATSSVMSIPTVYNVKAADLIQDDYTYKVEKQSGKQYIVLTDYKGKDEKIILPDEINGMEVRSVQDGFGKNSNLKSITLSKNIASVKDTKRGLQGLNQIGTLEEIQISNDNKAYYAKDGILYTKDQKELVAYPKSKKAETYIMPSKVNKIGSFSLTHLKYLKNLVFSKNIETILECSDSSVESIVTSGKTKVIDESAFDGCKNLKKVTFGKNVRNIVKGAFANCSSLKDVTIPESVLKIGVGAFDKNVKLNKKSYLKKYKKPTGAVYYEAKATVKEGKKAIDYKASKVTKIIPKNQKVTVKKGKKVKLLTKIYYEKKLKKAFL